MTLLLLGREGVAPIERPLLQELLSERRRGLRSEARVVPIVVLLLARRAKMLAIVLLGEVLFVREDVVMLLEMVLGLIHFRGFSRYFGRASEIQII